MNAYTIFMGKPEQNRAAGKPRRRAEDNIKMDLKRDRKEWYGLE
jgi:hypothetical protein